MNVYGNQQTNETIKANIGNWNSLHANKTDDTGLLQYNKERIRKHKIRLIEAFRLDIMNSG